MPLPCRWWEESQLGNTLKYFRFEYFGVATLAVHFVKFLKFFEVNAFISGEGKGTSKIFKPLWKISKNQPPIVTALPRNDEFGQIA